MMVPNSPRRGAIVVPRVVSSGNPKVIARPKHHARRVEEAPGRVGSRFGEFFVLKRRAISGSRCRGHAGRHEGAGSQIASPNGRFAPPNSAGGAAVSAPAGGVMYNGAYMKHVQTGGWGAPGGPTWGCKIAVCASNLTQAPPGVRRSAPSPPSRLSLFTSPLGSAHGALDMVAYCGLGRQWWCPWRLWSPRGLWGCHWGGGCAWLALVWAGANCMGHYRRPPVGDQPPSKGPQAALLFA
jgi:hypothetical protein